MKRALVFTLLGLITILGTSLTACFKQPELTFSPVELPNAMAEQPYHVTITISGNSTPVASIGVYEGELPEGLVIRHQERENNAVISGTPVGVGSYKFSIYASCLGTNINGQSGHRDYELIVE